MIYWDSSCVLKLYIQESDSINWLTLAKNQDSNLKISQLTLSEFYFALYAKEARKEILQGTAGILSGKFESDLQSGLYDVAPYTGSIVTRSIKIAKNPSSFPIRTLDGIHLACAIETGCQKIATADRRLSEVATRFGIEVVSV